jgi:predicted glycosyltransferase
MVDVWLDAVTPKDSLLVSSLLPVLNDKGYETVVTAKEQTQTTDVLGLLNIAYTRVGKYGETLKEKLVQEQKRTLGFVELFDRIGLPKVLWTHGDVSAIRTAFGLQMPIVYCNDTPHAVHVARLVCPLVNWIVAPVSFGKSWSRFGISKSRIVLYDGVEEIAWLIKPKLEPSKFLKQLGKKERVVLFRNVEYKASYCKDVRVDVWRLIEQLSKIAAVIYLPRYEEEREKLKDLDNVWIPPTPVLTFQVFPYVHAVVGSGGTICREAALMGVPTLNFHFWDAIAKYLKQKGFPIQHLTSIDRILTSTRKILEKPEAHRMDTRRMLSGLKSFTSITLQYVEECIKTG